MANEAVASLPAPVWLRETTLGYEHGLYFASGNVAATDLRGLSFPKNAGGTYNTTFVIPLGVLTTGLTFKGLVWDDGADASDLGKVVRFGITIKRLIAAETVDMDTAAGTEQTVDVTLQATSGAASLLSLAIANANLDSAAVGDTVAIRFRRVSTATQDTCNGRVIVSGLGVVGT